MISRIVFFVASALILAGWAKAYRLFDESEPFDALTFTCFTYSCTATIGPLALLVFVVLPHMMAR